MPALLLSWTFACERTPPTSGTGTPDGDADADTDADTDTDVDTDTDTDTDPVTDGMVVRVVTWNVESLDAVGSEPYLALRDVLARIDADVVALNEVDWDDDAALDALADDLGYGTVISPDTNPFGSLHNAVLTRLPVVRSTVWTSDALADESLANDLTRWPIAVEVETPGGGTLAVVSQHWKSGFFTVDEFRRVIDGVRTAQAASFAGTPAVLALGDVNAELTDPAPSIPTWDYVPDDVPGDYRLGSDLAVALDGPGIPNDVFLPMTDVGLAPVDARQMDGRYITRNESGRRLDYVFSHPSVVVVGAEVYDSADEGLDGLPKSGDAPEREASLLASDHYAVFVDVAVP